ncbi:MAG: glycosyltransferase [Lachnospiraceae bacterium]|nr:glycosyltransferase [Lachnospiraceae bacterium]
MQIIEPWKAKCIEKEQQTALITVVVTVFNVEQYLERAIESVLNQTYQNLEIILVDDGSTDKSREICEKYVEQDMRVQAVYQDNLGPGPARNAGIELAAGEYIAFLDGDDWVEEQMYEHLLSALYEQNADMAICRYRQVFKDHTEDLSSDRITVFEGHQLLKQYLLEEDTCLIQHASWNKLYKRSLIGELRFPQGYYEDMIYTMRLLEKPARSVYLDHAYYNYVRDRNGSIMNKGLNERIYTDLIPNLYANSAFLRQTAEEELVLLHDYAMCKRLLLFYTQVLRSSDGNKQEHLAFLEGKIKQHKEEWKKIFSIPQAKKSEYRNMQVFLKSVHLYTIKMRLDDSIVIPLKVMLYKLIKGE